jgi:hypothetical protein
MCGPSLIARLTIAVFVFLIFGVTNVIHAERPDSTAGTSKSGTRKLFIDPSSASVALRGKASLMVSPLTHRDGNYVGDYQLKVRPYFFKSEKGSLPLAASDDAVQKLQAGTANLPVKPSRTKTAELMSCSGGQRRHKVTAGASHFQS